MQDFFRCAHSWIRARIGPSQRVERDTGAATTDWILMIMVSITIATAVGAILVNEFTTAAESIDLGVNR
ncbi:hypothetical protein GCM10007147_43960 [Nocardiopsis kunsanensis]|uniref:DUF4244 domain-containing protein n=1 Tax=Nocardiopsis kunsanensis TaxID=141693 RepID=A0A918XKL5_9ACTN|nr:hypothetical protein GCM10007147_43960 [Nocardiopsis kunsanensis]